MSQLYYTALSYLYAQSNKHLGILTVTYDTTTTDITSTNVSTQQVGNAYTTTLVFDLSGIQLPSVQIDRLRYYAYKDTDILYYYDISITGLNVPRGTYVVTVTVFIVDDQVSWTLSSG